MLNNAELAWMKNTASAHLAQFDALDAIDQLNELVWRYEARAGRMPQSWQELIQAGVLRSVPLDPAGTVRARSGQRVGPTREKLAFVAASRRLHLDPVLDAPETPLTCLWNHSST